MKSHVIRYGLCAVAGLYAVPLFAALTISEPTNITEKVDTKYVGDIRIDANTTVSAGGKLYLEWAGKAYLPYSAGKDATVTIDGGTLEFYYTEADNPNHLYWGANGGRGHLVVKNGDNFANYLDVCPAAEADTTGYIDFARLEGGSLRGDFSITNTTAPARITFAGGTAYCAKTWATRTLYSIGPSSELVLQSENGAAIQYYLNQGDKQPSFVFAAGDGKLTTAGTGRLRFYGGGGSARVYFALPAAQTTWGHAGETVFESDAWPVLEADHALPHGAGTGPLVFAGQPNYLDMKGHTAAVNGCLREGSHNHYVTNSVPETEAELQFGARNEDSLFQLNGVYGNTTVAKLGTGTLTLQRGVFGKMRLAAGTVAVTNANVAIDELSVAAGATFTLKQNVTVRKLTLAAGAMLTVDGCKLTVDEIEGLDDTTYTHPNNGAIEWHVRTPTTVATTYTHYGDVYLHTNLTVAADVNFKLRGSNPAYNVYLPAAAGEEAVFTVNGQFNDPSGSVYARLKLGANGGRGTVVLNGGGTGPNTFTVSANAEPCAAGYIDALRLKGSTSWQTGGIGGGRTDCPTRITFEDPVNYKADGGGYTGPCISSRYAPDTGIFGPSANCRFDVVAEEGSAVFFNLNAGNRGRTMQINYGNGVVAFKKGPVVFYCHANGWFDGKLDPHARFTGSSARYVWENDADMILRRCVKVSAEAANVLPSGARTGVIRYSGYAASDYSFLVLAGCDQSINGLAYEGRGSLYVTNSTETVATLTVGATGGDCVFAPTRVYPNIIVRKEGAGTLVVSNTVMPRLDVAAGALRIASNGVTLEKLNLSAGTVFTLTNATLNVGELTIDGASVRIDGGTLAADRVTCVNGGTYSFVRGGKLVNAGVIETCVDSGEYPSRWTRFNVMDRGFASGFPSGSRVDVVKRNDDTFTYFHDGAQFGTIDVQAGRLRFGGSVDADHYTYWRLSIRKTLGSFSRKSNADDTYATMQAGLGRWWLTTADLAGSDSTTSSAGPSLSQWGDNAAAGTAPSALAENQWTTGKAYTPSAYAGGAQWLAPAILGRPFYSNGYEWYYSTVFSNDKPDPEDPSTWETIAVRLGASTKNVGGYLFSVAANVNDDTCHLVSWKVEASADGVTWTTMDDRTNYNPRVARSGYWYNHGNLFLFNRNADTWAFRPQGPVTVATNAVLDLDEIPAANNALAKLAVDQTAGAGTITVFAPAAGGELHLANVPAEKIGARGFIRRTLQVPITLGKTVGAENLATWRVYANGVEQKVCRAELDADGRLFVRRSVGTTVLIK